MTHVRAFGCIISDLFRWIVFSYARGLVVLPCIAFETLFWGSKVSGLDLALHACTQAEPQLGVIESLNSSYTQKYPLVVSHARCIHTSTSTNARQKV